MNIETIISADADQHPGGVGANDACVTTLSTPIRLAAIAVRPRPSDAGDAEADPARRPVRVRIAWAGSGSSEGRRAAGRRGLPSAGTRPMRRARRLGAVRRLGDAVERLLVDVLDLLGDVGPGVALGRCAAPPRPSPRGGAGSWCSALQLLGKALRVGRGHEDAVDAVGDDVGSSRRCWTRSPGCRRRTPRSGSCRSSRPRARGRRARRPRAGCCHSSSASTRPSASIRWPRLGVGEVAATSSAVGADHASAGRARARSAPRRRAAAPAGPCAPRGGRRTAPEARRSRASAPPAARRGRRRWGSSGSCRRTSAGRSRRPPRRRRSARAAG